jgi:carbohydrate kinase (thermoresistant glucokinase family)
MSATQPLIVVMGVSGSGKTTIGRLLAAALGVQFEDADDLHPASNVAKMAAGHPLTDDDRWPWLATVGAALAAAELTGLVMACSALKRSYRDAIRVLAPDSRFVELDGSHELLESRVDNRVGHFMPPALLDSQFQTLEPLAGNEPGVRISLDLHPTPQSLVAAIMKELE